MLLLKCLTLSASLGSDLCLPPIIDAHAVRPQHHAAISQPEIGEIGFWKKAKKLAKKGMKRGIKFKWKF